MKLTPKQEHFCEQKAAGKSDEDAYRSAYGDMRMELVEVRSYKLMQTDYIVNRIKKIKEEIRENDGGITWTKKESTIELRKILDDANPFARIAAIRELNIIHNLNHPEDVGDKTKLLVDALKKFADNAPV